MKTIDEMKGKRSGYGENDNPLRQTYERGFTDGVKFAQRWIPVEEELPEQEGHGFSRLVLTKDKFNNFMLERYDFEYNHFNAIRYDAIGKGDGQVTHWRSIELK